MCVRGKEDGMRGVWEGVAAADSGFWWVAKLMLRRKMVPSNSQYTHATTLLLPHLPHNTPMLSCVTRAMLCACVCCQGRGVTASAVPQAVQVMDVVNALKEVRGGLWGWVKGRGD